MMFRLLTLAALASAKQTPAECAQAKCFGQSFACLADNDCVSKVECALACDTESCIKACAGDNASSATNNLVNCAVAEGCVSPGFDADVVAPVQRKNKYVMNLSTIKHAVYSPNRRNQSPAECAQAKCFGDSFACLADNDCVAKVGCALECATESCIKGCAGANPSSATNNLVNCAIAEGCVAPGFETDVAAPAVKAAAAKQTPAECAQAKCFGQSFACLADNDCVSKVECALACETESCIKACAGDNASSATNNLVSCAVAEGCVSPGFDADVVAPVQRKNKYVMNLSTIKHAVYSPKRRNQSPAECAQAKCFGDSFACLADNDCVAKVGCALECATESCIKGCAGANPSSATNNLVNCAIAEGCVAPGFETDVAAPAVKAAAAKQTPAECAQAKCFGQSFACLADNDCVSKVECALACETESCIKACAGDNASSATNNLVNCAVAEGCVSPGFDADVVAPVQRKNKYVMNLSTIKHAVYSPKRRNQSPAECAQAKCFGDSFACLADNDCVAKVGCALECATESCIKGCAGANPSSATNNLVNCAIAEGCVAPGFETDVAAPAVKAAAAKQTPAECAQAKCFGQSFACLADNDCVSKVECALACETESCIKACAGDNASSATNNLVNCAVAEGCVSPGFDADVVAPVQRKNKYVMNLSTIKHAVYSPKRRNQSPAECAQAKCFGDSFACLADNDCVAKVGCALECATESCIKGCAGANPSSATNNLVNCAIAEGCVAPGFETDVAAPAVKAAAAKQTPAECAQAKCFGQSFACLADNDCVSKVECALACETESCIKACAGDNASSATNNLVNCAVAEGCVSPGFDADVVAPVQRKNKYVMNLSTIKHAVYSPKRRNQSPAECAQAKCFGDSFACLADNDCVAKVGCALECATESCIKGCAGANPSSATNNLVNCAIAEGCVAPGFVADVVNAAPTGIYHGTKDVLGVKIDGVIKVDDATHFDLTISGAASISCKSEEFAYDGSSKISLPNESSSDDCVHQQLDSNKIELESIDYDATKDAITVNVKKSIVKIAITLNKEGGDMVIDVSVPEVRTLLRRGASAANDAMSVLKEIMLA